MSESQWFYYDVALTLNGVWKKHIYTYKHSDRLLVGSVVSAPFGKQQKLGFVVKETKQPAMQIKEVSEVLPYVLPIQALQLYDWLTANYPNVGGLHAQHFLPSFLAKGKDSTEPAKLTAPVPTPPLTSTQLKAVKAINVAKGQSVVLHGITGSGKTRVYIELAREALEQGKNVLILYPEISLTSQLEKSLSDHLSDYPLTVFHSKQTPKQQFSTWKAVDESSGGSLSIGPRSALFLPHKNVGLLIVDEVHDNSYKQDTGSRYNGILVAGALARIHSAKLILGSATPPIQETAQVLAKNGSLICMHDLAITHEANEHKKFQIVDMTNKKNASGASYLLSKQLLSSIKGSLEGGKQTLLFLNRRGTARSLLCQNCGWRAECPRCDAPTTYHHDSFSMQCHICGFGEKTPISCPECQSSLTQRSPGTKSLEEVLKATFPGAKIARFDSDNKKADTFHELYDHIRSGGADILLGTQLITKGLDLPLLETVGILQADSSLALPDFASEERAFQLLTQVSGRVGRGHGQGEVIVQTYQPNNPLFRLVEKQDWHTFYDQELERRKKLQYPPHKYMAKIACAKSKSVQAEKACTDLAQNIASTHKHVRLLGPAPSFYEKSGGKYSWQLVLQSSSRRTLLNIVKDLPKDFIADIDPTSLL